LGTINYYLLEIIKKIKFRFSSRGREINRILSIPRYQKGITKIFGFNFEFVDSASFVGQYNEIIRKQIYKFNCSTNVPYIIDCGANVGVSILFFKKFLPEAEILAFEPDKAIYQILEQNIKNANLTKVTLINKAVWDNNSKKKFSIDGADSGFIIDKEENSEKVIEIETCKLKDVLIRSIDFLKIDIEGAEYKVINDCNENLKNVRNIFIEYHSIKNTKQNLGDLLLILQKNGFRYFIQHTTIECITPFTVHTQFQSFDNLLNIFAYKVN
jgi:FkbM family methyltransferase